ncbi:MAG: helix-turn-helix transcriptional regulator [Clostridia bacterium]|nr:helix-turn-helix transcriptional regulator [Clostridia bacterium]
MFLTYILHGNGEIVIENRAYIRSRDIADYFHFNPTYIGRVFKSHTGFTLRTFIVDYRINRAKEILRTQETSVGETAAAVGFTDVPHFILSCSRGQNAARIQKGPRVVCQTKPAAWIKQKRRTKVRLFVLVEIGGLEPSTSRM